MNELETEIRSAEQKRNISNLATIQSVTGVLNKIPDVTGFVKKSDYGTVITCIKNHYVAKANLISQLNDLKSQNIAEVKKVDDKVKKMLLILLVIKIL